MSKSHRATLDDLITVLAEDMSSEDLLQTIVEIEISRNIRNARRKLGWSQKEFAEKMGVTQSLVSRWESGECNYTIDTLAKIAVEMGLTMKCPLLQEENLELTAQVPQANRFKVYEAPHEISGEAIPFAFDDVEIAGGVA